MELTAAHCDNKSYQVKIMVAIANVLTSNNIEQIKINFSFYLTKTKTKINCDSVLKLKL